MNQAPQTTTPAISNILFVLHLYHALMRSVLLEVLLQKGLQLKCDSHGQVNYVVSQ